MPISPCDLAGRPTKDAGRDEHARFVQHRYAADRQTIQSGPVHSLWGNDRNVHHHVLSLEVSRLICSLVVVLSLFAA